MFVITFINGFKKIYYNKVTLLNIAKDIKYNFKKDCIAGYVNGILVDINTIIKNDAFVSFINKNHPDSFNIIRSSFIHVLGYSIKKCFPKSKLVNSGFTKDGFYYDVDIKHSFKNKDILLLEKNINFLIKKKYNILQVKISFLIFIYILFFSKDIYKIFFIKNYYNFKKYFLYFHEEHYDISIFPQVPNISFCKYYKLQKISGVYSKINNIKKVFQRIYGVCFIYKKDLKKYLNNINELKKRDHRKIGKKLNLFYIQEKSPGMIFWNTEGWIIFRELENFIRNKLKEYLYEEVKTPTLMNSYLWKKSGHWKNYKDSLFLINFDNKDYCIKPMNCPGHIELFKIGVKSYRDLPLRIAEFGNCHRNESSGSLHGLMRVRSFTQDDAHIFCSKDQIKKEINICIKMIFEVYKIFNFLNIIINFSTRPKKRIGDNDIWDVAEKSLEEVLKESNLNFNYKKGEGAFYGPKIEFILKDSLGRKWQCGTIQLDFYLSKRLNVFYFNKNNKKKSPIIIHRAILGSMERFIGILIEEYLGNFPTWLSPIQVVILSVNYKHNSYVRKIFNKFYLAGIRVKMNLKYESISYKIRENIIKKVPYIIICGDEEIKNNSISVRNRLGKKFKLSNIDNFIFRLINLIKIYSFDLLEE